MSFMRLVALAGLLTVTGCSKFTYQNWNKIRVGTDTTNEVRSILGDPWRASDGESTTEVSTPANANTWVYSDTDRNVTAIIRFREQTVVAKEWADPEHGLLQEGEKITQPGSSEQIRVRATE